MNSLYKDDIAKKMKGMGYESPDNDDVETCVQSTRVHLQEIIQSRITSLAAAVDQKWMSAVHEQDLQLIASEEQKKEKLQQYNGQAIHQMLSEHEDSAKLQADLLELLDEGDKITVTSSFERLSKKRRVGL